MKPTHILLNFHQRWLFASNPDTASISRKANKFFDVKEEKKRKARKSLKYFSSPHPSSHFSRFSFVGVTFSIFPFTRFFIFFLFISLLINKTPQPVSLFSTRLRFAECFSSHIHFCFSFSRQKETWMASEILGRGGSNKSCATFIFLIRKCGVNWVVKLTVHIGDSNLDYCLASILMTSQAPDANVNWERDAGERKATSWSVKTWDEEAIEGNFLGRKTYTKTYLESDEFIGSDEG